MHSPHGTVHRDPETVRSLRERKMERLTLRMNFQVAVSLGTGSVLLVGSSTTPDNVETHGSNDSRLPPSLTTGDADTNVVNDPTIHEHNQQHQTRGLVQLRILGRTEDTVDTQETSCYVLEGSNT